jgi:serine/threonine protein kinase
LTIIGYFLTITELRPPLDLPISRAYDIWSLGCVFLEFIIWLLDGPQGLEKFADDRLMKARDGVYDNSFFIVALRSDTGKYVADVRPSVREWIRDLHERGSALIHDLLDLIEQDMLVVRPQNRITSGRLSQKLERFATLAATDEGYMFQELAVAKRENEKYCEGIPDFLGFYWTKGEELAGNPNTISSNVSDLSVQQLVTYATSIDAVHKKCTSLYVNATWSLSRESDDDLAQSPVLKLGLASGLDDPILEHFASCMLVKAPMASPVKHIVHPDTLTSSVGRNELGETGSNGTELEKPWALGSLATSEASQDKDIFDNDQDDDEIASRNSSLIESLFGLEFPGP